MRTAHISLILLLVLCSCTTLETVHYRGETVTLSVQRWQLEAELLFLGDSCLYVIPGIETARAGGLKPGIVYSARYESLAGMEVENIANNDWGLGILLMEVAPAVLMGAAAASYSGGENFVAVTAACLLPAALNALLFSAGSAVTPAVDAGATPEQYRGELRRYARFPQGLTGEQLTRFLASLQQGEAIPLESALPAAPKQQRRGPNTTAATP